MRTCDLKQLYIKFNKKYFNNELPDLYVHYGKLPHNYNMGRSRFRILCNRSKCECGVLRNKYKNEVKDDRLPFEIIINNVLKCDPDLSIITLLHEMVHVSVGGKWKCGKNGKRFKKERTRIFLAGAYERLL